VSNTPSKSTPAKKAPVKATTPHEEPPRTGRAAPAHPVQGGDHVLPSGDPGPTVPTEGYPDAVVLTTQHPGEDAELEAAYDVHAGGGERITDTHTPVPDDVQRATKFPLAGPLDAPKPKVKPDEPLPMGIAQSGALALSLAHRHTGVVGEDDEPVDLESVFDKSKGATLWVATRRVYETYEIDNTDRVGKRLLYAEGTPVPKAVAEQVIAAAKAKKSTIDAALKS
jgi:hypothetical protein